MVRFFTILGWVCLLGGFALLYASTETEAAGAIIVTLSFTIASVLWVRRMFLGARSLASDAKALFDGDVREIRVLEVSDPVGFFNARSNVVLEVVDEDGLAHGINRDIPIPWPWALAIRFGDPDLRELLATRLRRQGVAVTVPGDPEPATPAAT